MNERQWLDATQPRAMLEFLQAAGSGSERKARLFAAACCRRIRHLLTDERLRSAVRAAEAVADRQLTDAQLESQLTWPYRYAKEALRSAVEALSIADPDAVARGRANNPSSEAAAASAAQAAVSATYPYAGMTISASYLAATAAAGLWHSRTATYGCPAELAAQCELIRDIFGNPFQPAAFAPAWRSRDAVAVAVGMYEARDFTAMPVLADALEDAGCDSADVLGHCREAGRAHVRGCWVVDLVLGRR